MDTDSVVINFMRWGCVCDEQRRFWRRNQRLSSTTQRRPDTRQSGHWVARASCMFVVVCSRKSVLSSKTRLKTTKQSRCCVFRWTLFFWKFLRFFSSFFYWVCVLQNTTSRLVWFLVDMWVTKYGGFHFFSYIHNILWQINSFSSVAAI